MEKTAILEIANMEGRYGIENYLMNMLRNFNMNKVVIYFLSSVPGPFDDEIKSYGCKIFRIAPLGSSISKIIKHNRELRMLFRNHPEIKTVHIHGNTAIGCMDARIAKEMGIDKIVIHSHNDGCNNIRSYALHLLGRLIIAGCATNRVCCSEEAGKWMFGNHNSFTVLKNAINLNKYRYSYEMACKLKRQMGLEGKKVIGHVGRMEKQKNHSFILDVFSIVHEKHPDTVLLLVGNGSLRSEIEDKVVKLGLTDSVVYIKQSDSVNELLLVMDIFLFPSLWEGLGISLVEAQASGLNCIASEAIKTEVCVTSLVERISVSKGAEEWSDLTWNTLEKNKDRNRDSQEYMDQLRIAGYDEKNAAEILQSLYIE